MKNKTCMTCYHYGLALSDAPCHDCYAMKDGSFSEWEFKSGYMDPEAFKNAMNELATSSDLDNVDRYREMNKLMCKVLRSLGYDEGIDIFKKDEGRCQAE